MTTVFISLGGEPEFCVGKWAAIPPVDSSLTIDHDRFIVRSQDWGLSKCERGTVWNGPRVLLTVDADLGNNETEVDRLKAELEELKEFTETYLWPVIRYTADKKGYIAHLSKEDDEYAGEVEDYDIWANSRARVALKYDMPPK